MNVVISAFGIIAIKIRFQQPSSTQSRFSVLTVGIYFLGQGYTIPYYVANILF